MRERLTFVGILFALLVCASGCGGSSKDASSSDETSTANTGSARGGTPTTDVTPNSEPIRCLDASGLSDVQERGSGLWDGHHDNPAYRIVVHKLAKPAKAPTVVAGTYALSGSFKVAAKGTGLTSDDGLLVDALVQDVAACLGG
jgi:hypothetical protein